MHLAEPDLLFARFEQDALTAGGARAQFELFVLDLVKVQFPGAKTVAGKGGRDWGIDTLVGKFSGGKLAIWQCKFVRNWTDDGPRKQVRDSFNSAVKHAKAGGYTIGSWELCVPCVLAPEEQKWFDNWAVRQRRITKIAISISTGADLRHQLIREDARDVRREYFPETVPSYEATAHVEGIAETDDLGQFDDALFVRQLQEAGENETDAARGLFFATDALVRDYAAKGASGAMEALKELHLDALQAWTHEFNSAAPNADSLGRMAGLHQKVLQQATSRPDPSGLRLRPVHKMGAVHRLVEDARAGWVMHWRTVAAEHAASAESANSTAQGPGPLPNEPGHEQDAHTALTGRA